MHSYDPAHALIASDIFWVDSGGKTADGDKSEFTINELANLFSLTHRALRFYESRGLLAPRAQRSSNPA